MSSFPSTNGRPRRELDEPRPPASPAGRPEPGTPASGPPGSGTPEPGDGSPATSTAEQRRLTSTGDPGRLGPNGDRRRLTPIRALLLATVVLAVAGLASLFVGGGELEIGRVARVLVGDGDTYMTQVVAARIPRTVMGVAVGAALAVSGVLIQGVTRNPLGEPGLLGVTMGASASVATATGFLGFSGGYATVWVAMPGAVLAVVVSYVLGRRAGGTSVIPLVLAGAVVSAVLGAYVQAMILLEPQVFDSYRHWVVGSLAGSTFDTLWAVLPAMVSGALLAWLCAAGLNSLALGEDVAVSLGVRVGRIRLGSVAGATLLAAAATAAVGPIAFVGLAVPHLVRALVGGDHRAQLPVAIVLGGALLVASDVVARVVAWPQELMVGVVTAFVGAPFLLAAVRRGKVST